MEEEPKPSKAQAFSKAFPDCAGKIPGRPIPDISDSITKTNRSDDPVQRHTAFGAAEKPTIVSERSCRSSQVAELALSRTMEEQYQQLEKKKMKVKKNPNKKQQLPAAPLNPNWAQLQQKLNSRPSSKPSTRPSELLVLGKRKERSDEERAEDPQPSPLVPANSDSSLTDALAMDCEMVGVGQANRSALGRVTLVNKWGNVVYDEFVRPMEAVVDFRTHISGIRPKDLKQAKKFPVVQKKVAELIKGRILVGHALSNDFKVLLLNHPKKDLRDSSEYPPFLKEHRRKSLKHLASEFLGIEIQNGEHCPVEDARAAMVLYQKNVKEWEKFAKSQARLNRKQQNNRRPKKKRKIYNDINHPTV